MEKRKEIIMSKVILTLGIIIMLVFLYQFRNSLKMKKIEEMIHNSSEFDGN